MVIKISLILVRHPTACGGIDKHWLGLPLRSANTMTSGFQSARRGHNARLWHRKPRRITITIPDITYSQLLDCSNRQGRSISNLAAYLLEQSVQESLDDGRDGLNHNLDNRNAA
jgi:hypothetical protein